MLLEPSRAQLERWVAARAAGGSHFMPPSLLESQLGTLEYERGELWAHFCGDPFPPAEAIVGELLARLAAG